jgi:serine/threonine-protein kinase
MREEASATEDWARRARRRGRRRLAEREGPEPYLPAPGTSVDGFTLVGWLGQGGFGTVYLARRGARLYALKLLYLPQAAHWAWRELEVMLRVRGAGGPVLEGHGCWPPTEPCFLYLAMEYVPGSTADRWARRSNPTAWDVARLVLALVEELEAVHAAGVVHRDVKLGNVLVRPDGRPVLVDFGAGTCTGAREVTGPLPVPGTRPYRSPEAVRFARGHAPGERAPSSPWEDLWALGVLLYWLLTGHYPFAVEGPDPGDLLGDAILHLDPVSPHVLNPRVPRALSEVCLRLLRKPPEARYASAREVRDALRTALEAAKEDAAWRVPLCAAWGPDTVTTEQEVELSEESRVRRSLRVERYEEERPVRGVPEPEPEPPTPLASTREAPGVPRAAVPWQGVTLGALAAMLLLAILLWGHGHSSRPVQLGEPGGLGQEVAPPWRGPEGGGGAVPPWAPTPAPVASATLSEDVRVKTPSSQEKKPSRKALGRTVRTLGVAGCTALAGCAGAQVVPNPPGEACPPGAVEAMRKAGYHMGYHRSAVISPSIGAEWIFVRPGSATLKGLQTGHGAQVRRFSGRLLFGGERVYGRFTEAELASGEVIPVCFELYDFNSGKTGVAMKGHSGTDSARIFSTVNLRVVRRFE